jgi:hypothetical protein
VNGQAIERCCRCLGRPPVWAASVWVWLWLAWGGRAGLVRGRGGRAHGGRGVAGSGGRGERRSTVKVAVDVATGPGDRGGSQFKNGTLTRSSTPATYSPQRT